VTAASTIAWLISLGVGTLATTALGWVASFDSPWQYPGWVGVFLVITGCSLLALAHVLPERFGLRYAPGSPAAGWTRAVAIEELDRYFADVRASLDKHGFGDAIPHNTPSAQRQTRKKPSDSAPPMPALPSQTDRVACGPASAGVRSNFGLALRADADRVARASSDAANVGNGELRRALKKGRTLRSAVHNVCRSLI
jgi:hypothetical protein